MKYIYSFDNAAWWDDSELEFTYNPTTGDVDNLGYYISYYNGYGDRIRIRDSYFDDTIDTQQLLINSINVVTGEVSLKFTYTYTADSNVNTAIYDTSGTLKLEFDGSLTVRDAYPTN